jgi:hypothetical protein
LTVLAVGLAGVLAAAFLTVFAVVVAIIFDLTRVATE